MFVEKGRAAIIEEEMPVCGPDTVLLRTLYSGVSLGTERMFLVGGNYGSNRPWPKRLAYQLVSEVVECGDEITRFGVGDVVFTGTFPGHVEYHLARERDLIVKLPEGFDLVAAAMLGVASVSFHDARRARVRVEDNVLVVGAGLIGQFAAQAARLMGARVTVMGHHDDRLCLAGNLGADAVANSLTGEGMEELERNKPYSVVFECSGGDVMDQIIGLPAEPGKLGQPGLIGRRSRARVVMVAGRYDVQYNFNMAGNAEVDILHTQHFDQDDLEQVVRLMARGDINARPLIRDVVPLDEAVRIFDILRDHPRRLLGTVFVMGGALHRAT
jgi:2-desacetyl-2-hydroxyethyl bacteriochlorophyllide A dehydrogenase